MAVHRDQHLQVPAPLRQRMCTEHRLHRHREQAVPVAAAPRLGLVQADPGKLGVGEHDVRAARLAGQLLSRSHQQLHGQRFREVPDSV